MSAILTVKVDGVSTDDPLGIKEAAVMALEHLGWARVLRVEIEDDEQLSVLGEAKRPPRTVSVPAPPPRSADRPKPQTGGKPRTRTAMECCLTCARYCSAPGRDAAGEFYYGTCGPIGAPVHILSERCDGWAPLQRRGER